MEHKYIFSIVMAVYNCEPFLRETLDSVVEQDISSFVYNDENGQPTDEQIPFEKIVQLIMVDDGSTDGSGDICDEYAAQYPNFMVIHKKNGGVASARNEGLKYIEGKYMNFLDSDDKFSKNVFKEIYKFFEQHYDETDVVTMPLRFFDAAKGAHWQNYKFSKHARIAELFNEYDCPLMFVNASFFKSGYKNEVQFDGRLVCGEDIKYISTILSEKMTMGLVPYCCYDYRRRSAGEESLIQSSKKKYGWYTDYFTYLVDWAVDFCKEKWGYIPYYFQNILVCDLKWRFYNKYDDTALKVLGEDGFEQYKKILASSLKSIEDNIILSQRSIWNEHKHMMLCYKYGKLPERSVYADDIKLRFNNTTLCWMSQCYTKIDFINIIDNTIRIEGFTRVLGCSADEEIKVALRVRAGKKGLVDYIVCEQTERDTNEYRLGEVMFRGISFIGEFSLDNDCDWSEISIILIWDNNIVVKKDIRYGMYSPIGAEYGTAYYEKNGYMVSRKDHFIYFEKCSKEEKKRREKKYLNRLKKSNKKSDKKAYYALTALKVLEKLKRKQVWLISDRVNKADDNGEALVDYLVSVKNPNIDIYYVLSKQSSDYERLRKKIKVVDYFSHKHKMLQLMADVIISSAGDEFVINPFKKQFAPYRRYIAETKFVFLQHGIIKDDLSSWLNQYLIKLSGFVTSAKDEYNSIVNGDYYYSNEKVWLTGLPRYDRLYHDEKKYITIMPTWRRYLMKSQKGVWYPTNKFQDSTYCKFYNNLLNDSRLLEAAERCGYKLCYMPHPNTQNAMEYFELDSRVQVFGLDKVYREIFAESDMIITDYSSIAFDFAYLEKPVIYAQFDTEEFFAGEHVYTKGYYEYERDGFGEVTYDLDTTINTIIEYMEKGCQLKPMYKERIEKFYAFHDKNNCARVYKKILELTSAEKNR